MGNTEITEEAMARRLAGMCHFALKEVEKYDSDESLPVNWQLEPAKSTAIRLADRLYELTGTVNEP